MEKSPVEKLLDENNADPIVLYNEKNEEVAFEQIALIPLNEHIYAILKPVGDQLGLGENEALVLELIRAEEEWTLELVLEDAIIDAVFADYYVLLEEEGRA